MAGEIERKRWDKQPYARLLVHYCDILEKELGHRWRIAAWSQESRIEENGDVRQRMAITVVADCERLFFVSFTNRVNWDWPEEYRELVVVDVRTPEANGIGGTRLTTTDYWIRLGTVKTFVHFDSPLRRGEPCTLMIDVFWPRMCLPFVRGHEPDAFVVSFGEPVDLVNYTVVLPEGFATKLDHVGLDPQSDHYALVMRNNLDGRAEVSLSVKDVAAYRKVGIKLDTLPP